MAAAAAVVAFAAFLGGWQGAPIVIETIGGAARAVSDVNGIVVDLDKLCKATDPLIDALGDAHPKSRALAALAGAADQVCAAAADGPTIATDAKLVGAVLTAIGAAETKAGGISAAVRVSDVPWQGRPGR